MRDPGLTGRRPPPPTMLTTTTIITEASPMRGESRRVAPRSERWKAAGLALAVLLAPAGCVKPSLRSDVREVRKLANAPLLPAVPPGHIDELEPREVDQLLAKPLDADQAVRI